MPYTAGEQIFSVSGLTKKEWYLQLHVLWDKGLLRKCGTD